MDIADKVTAAANTLMSEATLDELRELAQDLRTLTPDSALAELVETRIEQILEADEQFYCSAQVPDSE
jgi:hypothetical protein